jgi:hypothetical protein
MCRHTYLPDAPSHTLCSEGHALKWTRPECRGLGTHDTHTQLYCLFTGVNLRGVYTQGRHQQHGIAMLNWVIAGKAEGGCQRTKPDCVLHV